MTKLTKPQTSLLRDIKHNCDVCNAIADTYAPAKKLVELGLAVWQQGRYGSTYLLITDAGRVALNRLHP